MTAVLINAGAIIAGSFTGLLIKKILNDRVRATIMQGLGIAVVVIGLIDAVKTENILFLFVSLVAGGLLGSLLKIEEGVNKFGAFLESKLARDENDKVGKAFVTASLIVCIGGMAVYGSLQAGIGQPQTLYIKALLDGVISLMLSAALGWGVALSAMPLLVIEGVICLSSGFLIPIVNDAFLNLLSGIGGALVTCVGINLLEIKEIHTANLIPAVLGAFLAFLL